MTNIIPFKSNTGNNIVYSDYWVSHPTDCIFYILDDIKNNSNVSSPEISMSNNHITDKFEIQRNRLNVERDQNWMGEINNIPFIKFPPDWKIKVIPPFGDASVRFQVLLPDGRQKSVYLDTRNSLGFFWENEKLEPYWEVYPVRGDTGRCQQWDTIRLLDLIDSPQGEEDGNQTKTDV
jgi:hypothetical protein